MDVMISDEIVHNVNKMEAMVIRVDPGIIWYREKSTGAIASIDSENKKYWEKINEG